MDVLRAKIIFSLSIHFIWLIFAISESQSDKVESFAFFLAGGDAVFSFSTNVFSPLNLHIIVVTENQVAPGR